MSNADIDLDIETRHTPSIGETLISAARLVDEKDCKIVLQSKDRGGAFIETSNGVKIPLDRDERELFSLLLKPQTTADQHSGADQATLNAYQPWGTTLYADRSRYKVPGVAGRTEMRRRQVKPGLLGPLS